MKEAKDVIKAWDKLEGDNFYTPKQIEEWLIKHMGPAIKKLRKALDERTKSKRDN